MCFSQARGPLPSCSRPHGETKSSRFSGLVAMPALLGMFTSSSAGRPRKARAPTPAQPQWPLVMSPPSPPCLPRILKKANRAVEGRNRESKLSHVDKGKIRREGPRGRSGTKLVPKPLGVTEPQHSCDISSRHLRHNNNSSDQSSSVFRQL